MVDRIYPIELEIKYTTNAARSASYLDLHLDIDSEGRLGTQLYDKRDKLIFPLWTFHLKCSNILPSPVYGVYHFSVDSIFYGLLFLLCFLDRGLLLTMKLLNQEFLVLKVKSYRTCFGQHHDLVNLYGISVSQMTPIAFRLF